MEDYSFLMLAQAENGTEGAAPEGGEAAPGGTEGTATENTEGTTQPDPGKTEDGTDGKGTGKSPFSSDFLFIMVLMFVVIYFVMMRPQKKKQQKVKDMLGSLKKNDRVRTIGGIIGTIVDVREDEVVIKIDEANNTKVKMVRNAISTVIVEEEVKLSRK